MMKRQQPAYTVQRRAFGAQTRLRQDCITPLRTHRNHTTRVRGVQSSARSDSARDSLFSVECEDASNGFNHMSIETGTV